MHLRGMRVVSHVSRVVKVQSSHTRDTALSASRSLRRLAVYKRPFSTPTFLIWRGVGVIAGIGIGLWESRDQMA